VGHGLILSHRPHILTELCFPEPDDKEAEGRNDDVVKQKYGDGSHFKGDEFMKNPLI
jgi:hypothetical protein